MVLRVSVHGNLRNSDLCRRIRGGGAIVRQFMVNAIRSRSYVLDLLVALLLITTIYYLVGQRNQTENLNRIAEQNHELNVQNSDILHRIKSCTDPNGQCYVENTKRSDDAVGNINQIVVLANVCVDKPGEQTVAETQQCVRDLLKSK